MQKREACVVDPRVIRTNIQTVPPRPPMRTHEIVQNLVVDPREMRSTGDQHLQPNHERRVS